MKSHVFLALVVIAGGPAVMHASSATAADGVFHSAVLSSKQPTPAPRAAVHATRANSKTVAQPVRWYRWGPYRSYRPYVRHAYWPYYGRRVYAYRPYYRRYWGYPYGAYYVPWQNYYHGPWTYGGYYGYRRPYVYAW